MDTSPALSGLSVRDSLLWALGAVICFHLAYSSPALSFLILGYPFCVFQLARAKSTRQSFYLGLAVGLLIAGFQLNCFWVIFGPGAIALWLVLAFWIGLFTAISRLCLIRFGPRWGFVLTPFIWTGLEYFRSELYYLRFSWLNIGYAFSDSFLLPAYKWVGMYGIGFLTMTVAIAILIPRLVASRRRLVTAAAITILCFCAFSPPSKPSVARAVKVAGVQLEFPTEDDVISALDKLLAAASDTELFVLSEYTFDDPVPEKVRNWCHEHQRYLIAGGKDPAQNENFYDTAFVIAPSGDVVFRQVKAVPIQFFKDGLPAPEQRLWHSPWGEIGLCVCYDLSYTRVTDRLIRLGAQAIIVPTMDVANWGRREHELHARVAPVRAAEYGVPIFRVASSGISQFIDSSGRTIAKAGFPSEGETLGGTLELAGAGSLPLDRWLAPLAALITGLAIVGLLVRRWFPAAAAKKLLLTTSVLTIISAQAAQERPPNIIFVLADDLGWSELGCYSNRFNETPNLDRLAQQGMRFTAAYASAPVCSPTRAALMTGQWPARLHITDYLKPDDSKFLSPTYVTLNQRLKSVSYISGLIGKWHLNGDYARRRGTPAQHGFDEVICSEQSDIGNGSYWHPYRFMTNVAARSPHEYLTDRLNQEALDFIQRHATERFFLYLAHYAPHTRLDARPDKLQKFKAKADAAKNKNNAALAAMLESIDDGVGEIMSKLDELRLADNTVLIFMSDNGGERTVTDNFPLKAGKSFLYEGGLRVPCIVRWPGKIKPAAVSDEPIIAHDFYPTFAEIAGVKITDRQAVDGESLVPLLEGARHLKRDTLYWHYPMEKPHFLGGHSASAIRKGDFKLIEFLDSGKAELYDLKHDLPEANDLANSMPKKRRELQNDLLRWRQSVQAE